MEGSAGIYTAARLLKEAKVEYAFDGSIFSEDNPKTARTKWIIEKRLEEDERNIILLYIQVKSMAEVARMLGIGRSTAAKEVLRIRKKILKEYDNLGNDMLNGNSGVRS